MCFASMHAPLHSHHLTEAQCACQRGIYPRGSGLPHGVSRADTCIDPRHVLIRSIELL